MEPQVKSIQLGEFVLVFIALLVVAAIFMAVKLSRKYEIMDTLVVTLKKFAPLILIFAPAILTYLFICGAFSATAFAAYLGIRGRENFDGDEFLLMEKIVEFACSFFVPLGYFVFLKKYKFEFFWSIIITIVHMLAAGYRDAKYVPINLAGNGTQEVSGPRILQEIQLLDATIPLLSLLVFIFLISSRVKIKES